MNTNGSRNRYKKSSLLPITTYGKTRLSTTTVTERLRVTGQVYDENNKKNILRSFDCVYDLGEWRQNVIIVSSFENPNRFVDH